MSEQTFFTADTHFGHTNIIKYCNRPFQITDEMDETIIKNWNDLVRNCDRVYHLGDFAFGNTKKVNEYIDRLNGQIHLILGNHDSNINKETFKRFQSVSQIKRVKFPSINLVLCHYKMFTWDRGMTWDGEQLSKINTYHLFGHSHGGESTDESFDVGVDCWNYKLINLDLVIECFKNLSKGRKQ